MASIMKLRALKEAQSKWDNILILGSGLTAPMIKDIKLDGWKVLAINNAWKLGVYDWLIYPVDFRDMPAGDRSNHIQHFNYFPPNFAISGKPEDRGDTMMFNSAYYAMAMGAKNIGFLGCDMHYPKDGSNTHFYGTGKPDPLRFGMDNLHVYMDKLQEVADRHNVNLYNFSPDSQVSLLPYKRAGVIDAKKSLFISFNEPYMKYAEALIKSFWRHHSKSHWTIECFTTNISTEVLQNNEVFNNPNVFINNEQVEFMNTEEERCYMNSIRFVRYMDKLNNYDFIWMSDVDAICLGNLDDLNFKMIGYDIGVCHVYSQDNNAKIRAGTLVFKNNGNSSMFLEKYKEKITALRNKSNTEWFNDQIAMYEILEENKNIKVFELDYMQYNSLKSLPVTKMLMTVRKNKFANVDYKREYDLLMNA